MQAQLAGVTGGRELPSWGVQVYAWGQSKPLAPAAAAGEVVTQRAPCDGQGRPLQRTPGPWWRAGAWGQLDLLGR